MNLSNANKLLITNFGYTKLFDLELDKAYRLTSVLEQFKRMVGQKEYAKKNAVDQISYWRKQEAITRNAINLIIEFN